MLVWVVMGKASPELEPQVLGIFADPGMAGAAAARAEADGTAAGTTVVGPVHLDIYLGQAGPVVHITIEDFDIRKQPRPVDGSGGLGCE